MSITLDGIRIESKPNASILDAARAAGVYIPTLCSHPDLPVGRRTQPNDAVYRGADNRVDATAHDAFGGCQLCLVEVVGTEKSFGQ